MRVIIARNRVTVKCAPDTNLDHKFILPIRFELSTNNICIADVLKKMNV